ncbi:MAG: hypothetical protein V3W41_14360 [Planctomycetota bacterium]
MRFFVFLFLVTVRLRAQEQDTDTNELATRLQSEVAELRGLSFRRPCKVGVYTRAQLREVVQELTAMELDKPAVKAQFEAFRLLGLLNADFDAKKGVEQLLASQIAGFYDPEKKELFLIREEPGARSKALDLVGRRRGRSRTNSRSPRPALRPRQAPRVV